MSGNVLFNYNSVECKEKEKDLFLRRLKIRNVKNKNAHIIGAKIMFNSFRLVECKKTHTFKQPILLLNAEIMLR